MASRIADIAEDLFSRGEAREFSQVIASRIGTTEAVVDFYLTGMMLQHRADARNLREGWRNADSMAAEASKGVWE